MKFFFYANYLNSNLEAENFVQKLKNFINCVLVKFFKVLTETKVNFILGCQKQDNAFSCALACAVNLMKLTISMFIFRTITFLYIAYIQHLAC